MTSRRSPKHCSRSSALFALALLAGGCVERSLDTPDDTFDFAGTDLAFAPIDAAAPDLARGPMCSHAHTRSIAPLIAARTVDGTDLFSPTAAVRLLVDYSVRKDCDVPADIIATVTLGNATTLITLAAEVWSDDQGCGAPFTITREITLSASQTSNAMIVVRDSSSPSAEPLLFLSAIGSFSPMCAAVSPGSACDDDCDCNGSDVEMLCLVSADGVRRCARACEEDSQCRFGAGGTRCLGAPDYVCGTSSTCRVPFDCAFGEKVESCTCTPPLTFGPAPPFCTCDDECPEGMLCGDGHCLQACTGDHTCGTYGAGEGGTECMNGQCLQLI